MGPTARDHLKGRVTSPDNHTGGKGRGMMERREGAKGYKQIGNGMQRLACMRNRMQEE